MRLVLSLILSFIFIEDLVWRVNIVESNDSLFLSIYVFVDDCIRLICNFFNVKLYFNSVFKFNENLRIVSFLFRAIFADGLFLVVVDQTSLAGFFSSHNCNFDNFFYLNVLS
jgi:hypothetical protein